MYHNDEVLPHLDVSVLSYVLPSCWTTGKIICDARDILGPPFAEKRKEQDEGTNKPTNSMEPNDVEWPTEPAKGDERNLIKLMHYEILLARASVRTSLFTEINFSYDVMQNPKYIDMLHDEVVDVAKEGWVKQSYAQLDMIDSLLCGSRRFNPPASIGLHRIIKEHVALGNGMLLPKGAYVGAGTWSIQRAATVNPEKFDGLRSYNQRQGHLQSSKGLFTPTEKTVLAWELEKSACPGRWFASLALKIIFSRVLTEYDFKFTTKQNGRPQNDIAHEILFPDRSMTILIRRRKDFEVPFWVRARVELRRVKEHWIAFAIIC